MKFNEKVLALAAATSIIFWYTLSSLFVMIAPGGFLRFILSRIPMNLISIMIVNGIIIFVSAFLMAFTAAYLYNRWGK